MVSQKFKIDWLRFWLFHCLLIFSRILLQQLRLPIDGRTGGSAGLRNDTLWPKNVHRFWGGCRSQHPGPLRVKQSEQGGGPLSHQLREHPSWMDRMGISKTKRQASEIEGDDARGVGVSHVASFWKGMWQKSPFLCLVLVIVNCLYFTKI